MKKFLFIENIKKIISIKEKKIELEKINKMDLNSHSEIVNYVDNIKNIHILNKLFKEYKKITRLKDTIHYRLIIAFILSTSLSLCLFYFGKEDKDVMKYVFIFLNFVSLFFVTFYCALRDYYDDIRKLLIVTLKEDYYKEVEDKIVLSILRKIKSEYEKEYIFNRIQKNDRVERIPMKKRV